MGFRGRSITIRSEARGRLWDIIGITRIPIHFLPGLSDLTTHVDFTAIADAGARAGLTVAGYASQASFLLSCGLLDLLQTVGAPDSAEYLRAASAVQTLTSPAEMGELVKVLALARGDAIEWPGFAQGDRSHRL
jgi:SAM-dependent MidA family methyltransferase